MDPEHALFLVCRFVYRLRTGCADGFLAIDEAFLWEMLFLPIRDYRPRFVVLADFRSLVAVHYGRVGVSLDFLDPTDLVWMLVFFERLVIGDLTLSSCRPSQPETINLD